MFKAVICFVSIFLFMLILSPEALSASKSWRYTIVNHTNYDIVVSHNNCNTTEWSGSSPCSNFNNVRIPSKTSASRDQTASNRGKKSGQIQPVIKLYDKGTWNYLLTYTAETIEASNMALYSSYYIQSVGGGSTLWSLTNIWVRASGESFLNIYQTHGSGWMADVDGNKTIAQIAIPGTHDSGAFDSSYACECQASDPVQQLNSGVRLFDFRLKCQDNELVLTHGSCTFDYEHKVSDYLDAFKSYLEQYPGETETIIIYAKEENEPENCGNYGNSTSEAFRALLAQKEAAGLKIMKDYNNVFPTLDDVRGKVMIFSNYNIVGCCNYPILMYSWPDQTTGYDYIWSSASGSRFYIEDAYRNKSANKWDIVRPLLEAASSNADPQKMYYTYTSAYAPGAPNPAAQASDINKWLAEWLSQNPGKTPAGAIIADYINCAKFAGIVVTQYCDAFDAGLLPLMIYSTNY